ncbi:uncharacterized protein BCR38DRAFT_457578 [Pseudomassariella vexata]|uniref:Cardiolipin synthase N-terminal domain-containing protein n=1 Tax=Pseudomassariella vexata TaxID=1141098 RepID=A0A1Y2E1I4_9PEZI|nr:uncharacterized protein BCR38DRAFT_457578 [Pseudomassariella vexata]ORY65413.1 hypothetical protein BCR38DRAFT_457578 [Pseudomassariella vexata]
MLQNPLSLFLQLCLATLACAAPIADDTFTATQTPWQYGTGGGVLGFLVLILDILVFIEVLKSNRPTSNKVLWCLVVFLFPIIGMVIYFLFSNRAEHNSGGSYEPLP